MAAGLMDADRNHGAYTNSAGDKWGISCCQGAKLAKILFTT